MSDGRKKKVSESRDTWLIARSVYLSTSVIQAFILPLQTGNDCQGRFALKTHFTTVALSELELFTAILSSAVGVH